MLPVGFSQPKPPIRLVPIGGAIFTLNLGADDPDFIVLVASGTLFSTSIINLPAKAALGKMFRFALVTDPVANPTLTTQYIDIVYPLNSGVGTGTWQLLSGQRPDFYMGTRGWVGGGGGAAANTGTTSQTDLAIGSGANGGANGVAVGSVATANSSGVAVGSSTNGSSNGAAVGRSSDGSIDGVAIGAYANGTSSGVAVGRSSNGNSSGVAVGFAASTSTRDKAVAIGYYSAAQRYREMTKSADGASTTLRSWSMVDWYGDTTNATATEILLGGTAAQYCLLLNNSAIMFSIQIIAGVTAGGDTSSYTIMGAIKRGATAASTALVGTPAIVMTGQDAGAALWAVAVTADTTNGSLKLTVTGQAATTIRWNATATLSEMRY